VKTSKALGGGFLSAYPLCLFRSFSECSPFSKTQENSRNCYGELSSPAIELFHHLARMYICFTRCIWTDENYADYECICRKDEKHPPNDKTQCKIKWSLIAQSSHQLITEYGGYLTCPGILGVSQVRYPVTPCWLHHELVITMLPLIQKLLFTCYRVKGAKKIFFFRLKPPNYKWSDCLVNCAVGPQIWFPVEAKNFVFRHPFKVLL